MNKITIHLKSEPQTVIFDAEKIQNLNLLTYNIQNSFFIVEIQHKDNKWIKRIFSSENILEIVIE